MKCIVGEDVVLLRPLKGPLSAHIAGFAKWARDEGYALYSRQRQVLLAAYFSRWFGDKEGEPRPHNLWACGSVSALSRPPSEDLSPAMPRR
jgi:hypothetical protein